MVGRSVCVALLLLALLAPSLLLERAQAATDGPIGFASVNALGQNGTTGGAGGPVVTVTTAAELIDYMARTGPYVIQVAGTISLPVGTAKGMHNVASDKTIIGLGANATISGGGFNIGLPVSDVTSPPADAIHNVIIRNLNFRSSPDDAINVQMFSHHVWIDHNDLTGAYDGLIDIKRGSDYVTVSWNHTHNHAKSMLLGHDDNNGPQDIGRLRVTFHHNWFNYTSQRNPRVRFAEPVHVFNNYFIHNSDYGVASAEDAGVVVEGNYFLDVEEPLVTDKFGTGRAIERNNIYAGESGAPEPRGTVVEPRTYYSYTVDDPASVPALIQAGVGTGKIGTNPLPTGVPTVWPTGVPTLVPTTVPTAAPTQPPSGCGTANAGAGWQNAGLAAQSGTFTARFTATPSQAPYEAVFGLSNGAKTADSGFAVAVRFNTSGRIDARGQGSYVAASPIAYTANTAYQFRLVVNVPAHTYSVYVSSAGGAEQTVASNIAFRSEQSSVTQLNNRGIKVVSSSGTLTICDLTIDGVGTPTSPATATRTTTAVPTVIGTPPPTVVPGAGPIGFASVNALGQNGTTGGAGGQTVVVDTAAELEDYVGRPEPYIIRVAGRIQISDMITVVANKSILGIGADAEITGGGLQLGSTTRPGNNVIIRNLKFTNASDDSVSVTNGAHHVWIDHCEFSNGYDGLLDVKRQSDYVTVSWNHFHHHSKTLLLGHSDGYTEDIGHLRVTYHHNFFDGTEQRHPRARFGEPVHVYNNYYRNNGLYGVASTENAGVLVEGNYFENVAFPIYVGYAESAPGRVVERNNLFVNSGTPQTAGSVIEPGTYYSYTVDNPANIPAIVTSGVGVGRIGL